MEAAGEEFVEGVQHHAVGAIRVDEVVVEFGKDGRLDEVEVEANFFLELLKLEDVLIYVLGSLILDRLLQSEESALRVSAAVVDVVVVLT